VFGVVIIINVVAFVILVSTAGAIAGFFSEPRLVPIIWALSLQFPILAVQVIPEAIIRRRMAFQGKSVANFGSMIAGSVVTLVLALSGIGVWSLVIGNICTVLARTIGYNVVARYACWPSFNFSGLRRMVTFGTQVTAERFFWFLYTQSDIFIVGRILGKELLGFYSVAMHLASLPMTKLGELLNELSFSGFSRIQDDPRQVIDRLLKATSIVSFFAFPVFFGISSTAPEIVSSVLGEKWMHAALPLQLLSLVVPLRMLDLIIPSALMGTGRADVSVGNAAIAAVILPVSFVVGLRWGLIGVCYGWIVGYSIYYLISLSRSLPMLGVTFGAYFRTAWPAAGCAALMLFIVHATRELLPEAWGGGFAALSVLVSVGFVTFTALSLAFQRDNLEFVVSLLRR
jgi:O-antigen/teichoic acid export membrane protein